MAQPVHEFVYLQPYEPGLENCILVRCAEFNVPPFCSWFYVALVKDPAPKTLRTVDSTPVIYIPAPRAVALELAECAKKEGRAKRAMTAVPASLAPMDLPTWVEYMEQFTVAVVDDAPLPDGPPLKRQRFPDWFPTAVDMQRLPDDESVVLPATPSSMARDLAYFAAALATDRDRHKHHTNVVIFDNDLGVDVVAELAARGYTMRKGKRIRDADPPAHWYALSWKEAGAPPFTSYEEPSSSSSDA